MLNTDEKSNEFALKGKTEDEMLAEAVPFYKDLFSKCVTTPSALSKIGSFIKHDEEPFSALAKPFDEEECLENTQAMHVGKSPGPDGLPIEFWNKVWSRVASTFVLICNEAHLCMPQSWKQGQVRLIPKKDKPRTIGDARPITLLNADYKIYSHMLAWRLRKSMTTLCSPSQRAFIPSRDIRNNIVLVNSLIDGNTDGFIMMLDWAKAYDSVDHEYLEKVLFYMECSGIGLQRLMSTAKGFTQRVIGSQSVSEPFNRE